MPTSRFAALALVAVCSSAVVAQTDYKPPADFAAKAGEYMAARVAHRGFTGAVLVAHHGKPLFAAGYGLADRDHDIPNTTATKFRIGSVTKQFTAVAVLRLEEQGKLKISAPIGQHLPDCPTGWAEVTIHQLLSHTGGVPEHTTPLLMMGNMARSLSPVNIVGLVKDKPLDFTPGEKWAYSNTGYILLGMLIEKASGQKYADFIREAVLTPAGMADSGVERSGQVLKNRARGYGGPEQEAQFIHMSFPHAAGAMYSTVSDLLKWDRALAGDKLLGAAAKKTLTTEVKDGYACGVSVREVMGRPAHRHGGGIPGFVSDFLRFPDDGLAVVVLTNQEDGRPNVTADGLAAIALRKPYLVAEPVKRADVSDEELGKWAGTYVSGDRKLVVSRHVSGLSFKVGDGAGLAHTPVGAGRFVASDRRGESVATFTRPDGKPPTVTVRRNGDETTWTKSDAK
jgi:CubicO group peptidase (beta-lactamase class C family)